MRGDDCSQFKGQQPNRRCFKAGMTAPNLKDNNRIADVSTQVQNADACGSFLKGPHAGNKYSSERRVNARNLVI